ncbi:MAG: aminodeoxychorismate synthase component I [Luteolibacter sp.]
MAIIESVSRDFSWFLLASAWREALVLGAMEEFLVRSVTTPTRLDGLTPVEVAGRLRHLDGLVFFDTAGNFPSSGSRPVSVMSARPERLLTGSIFSPTARETLRAALANGPKLAGDRGFPLGGLCGWVDYEGEFVFGDYREMLIYCHDDHTWWETGRLSECLRETPEAPAEISPFTATTLRENFIRNVQRAKDWIAAGDIYQVNLSQAFEASVSGGPLFGLYETLREASPAPMASYLALDGREVLSSSPETFLKFSGRGIETRPIKGTRPRFADPDEDRRSAYELQTSTKEISELVMITDLLRNDLGQVCDFGSVAVAEMLQLETLAQVHHLVSTVTGTLRREIDTPAALAACFPGGSITGAPKKRAMEIIHQLERSPRGIYCGSIGWLGYNGESSLNIAIRTLVRSGDRLVYQVGAGIVADSDPEKEYEETLHKAAGIRLAVERWQSRTVPLATTSQSNHQL